MERGMDRKQRGTEASLHLELADLASLAGPQAPQTDFSLPPKCARCALPGFRGSAGALDSSPHDGIASPVLTESPPAPALPFLGV